MKTITSLFGECNSDKQSGHRYGFIYDLLFTNVFHKKGKKLKVLEIGVSEYGNGSLKAYAQSDMVKLAIGVDIKPYIGNVEENMRFYQIDAYTEDSISFLLDKYGEFDIIIDDGSHTYEDQTFFLDKYVELLQYNGFLVCEDVHFLKVINEQSLRDDVFVFDGWGNLELGLKSFTDDKIFRHNERIIIKSNSESITKGVYHDNKPHIVKLPTVPFKEYEPFSSELVISVPLYHPDFPDVSKYDPDDFKNKHCRGAIWAGMSMLHNTDLADNGVPLLFHIEDKVWDDAMPVFEEFGVSEKWCRKMTLPKPTIDLVGDKAQFGKSLMCLIDDDIDCRCYYDS